MLPQQERPNTMTLSELLFDLEVLLEQVIMLNLENQELRRENERLRKEKS